MTCFRLKDGMPVARLLPYCRYTKFRRLIEDGYDTESAYQIALTYSTKNVVKRDKIRFLFKREPTQKNFTVIEGYICRNKCGIFQAIKWAIQTGRIDEKELREGWEQCRKDVD